MKKLLIAAIAGLSVYMPALAQANCEQLMPQGKMVGGIYLAPGLGQSIQGAFDVARCRQQAQEQYEYLRQMQQLELQMRQEQLRQMQQQNQLFNEPRRVSPSWEEVTR